MTVLPGQASDPFLPLRRRLEFTAALYRFDPQGTLVDWAVAQSGLGDPLSRFSRHELEEFFRLWAIERDAHLARLLSDNDARMDPAMVRAVLAKAPTAAQVAARRAAAAR